MYDPDRATTVDLFDGVANDVMAINPAINTDTMARNIRNFHHALLQTITDQIQIEAGLKNAKKHPLFDVQSALIAMGNKWPGKKEIVA